MIVARTKLKKIPEKCIKCKFCKEDNVGRFVKIKKKACKEANWITDSYIVKRCLFTAAEVPYVYNKEKRNWEYTKCKTCPLIEKEN